MDKNYLSIPMRLAGYRELMNLSQARWEKNSGLPRAITVSWNPAWRVSLSETWNVLRKMEGTPFSDYRWPPAGRGAGALPGTRGIQVWENEDFWDPCLGNGDRAQEPGGWCRGADGTHRQMYPSDPELFGRSERLEEHPESGGLFPGGYGEDFWHQYAMFFELFFLFLS